MAHILVVDDEISIRKAITLALQTDGHEVHESDSRGSAYDAIDTVRFDLVVTDLFIPVEADGLAILQRVKERRPETMVMIITAHGSIERAVDAVKKGADDFLAKGFEMEELKLRLTALLEQKRLREENVLLAERCQQLQREVQGKYRFDQIIGTSDTMRKLFEMLTRIIDDSSSTILIHGESGTGKELIARAIHYNGARRDKPFAVINCSALPEHLLESELFGYMKGAFTGALKDKPGKFEVADGGSIFLDEISEISSKVQVELLRFVQDKSFERVGDNRQITVDVRIITATNKQLEEEVRIGRFREDLFYRLNVIPLHVPSLRERKDDLPLLVDHFTKKFEKEKGRRVQFAVDAIEKMMQYEWRGNVRELENLIERFVVTSSHETILAGDLPREIIGTVEKNAFDEAMQYTTFQDACESFEKAFLLRNLEQHRWNITEVADALGERRDTLSKKIKRYGLKGE